MIITLPHQPVKHHLENRQTVPKIFDIQRAVRQLGRVLGRATFGFADSREAERVLRPPRTGQPVEPATAAAIRGSTRTTPANPAPSATGTTSTFMPGSGACSISPCPR